MLPSDSEQSTAPDTPMAWERAYTRNLYASYVMATLGGLAAAFSHGGTLMPVFINNLTDRKIAIGILSAGISVGFFFPQLFGAYLIHPARRVKGFIAIAYVSGVLIMGAIAGVAYGLTPWPGLALVLFLGLSWLFFSFYGFVNPAQIVLVGKIIPPEKRGMFFGIQSFFSNGAGIAGGLIVAFVLGAQGFPMGYGTCFLIATVFLAINALTFRLIHEEESINNGESTSFMEYLRQLPEICRRDNNFAWFIAARNFMAVANVLIIALIPVYCLEHFEGVFQESDIGLFTMAFMMGQCVASPFFGFLGSKVGFGKIMGISAILHILRMVVLMVIPMHMARWGVLASFFIGGAFLNALVLASNNLVLNFAPPRDRHTYMALSNGTRTPFLLAAPIVGGWLVDYFNYFTAYWVSIGCAIAAIILFSTKIRDPGPMR